MAWVDVSCPRCSLNRRINSRGKCICGAVMIYAVAPRVEKIDCRGLTVFQWYDDDRGNARVHPEINGKVIEKRGVWMRVQADWLVFSRTDRRKTARHNYIPGIVGTRFAS